MRNAANIASQYQHILCVGKQTMYPIAKELALKIKELAYIHAEAIAAGELKHGPLALIDHKVLTIVLDSPETPEIQNCIEEVKARGGAVLLISPQNKADIPFSQSSPLSSVITSNICCQLLAYYMALNLNRPIDKPRNLAKSVTVE